MDQYYDSGIRATSRERVASEPPAALWSNLFPPQLLLHLCSVPSQSRPYLDEGDCH